jgi:hypothetical protein
MYRCEKHYQAGPEEHCPKCVDDQQVSVETRVMPDHRFKNTGFVVEANSFEEHTLWREYHKSEVWEQETAGLMIEVGKVNELPVCISCTWSIINGMRVLFWDATSRMVDHKMIEAWFEENCCPRWANDTRVAKTNAMNFHRAVDASRGN